MLAVLLMHGDIFVSLGAVIAIVFFLVSGAAILVPVLLLCNLIFASQCCYLTCSLIQLSRIVELNPLRALRM